MDKNDIFREVQKRLMDIPIFLIGTGVTIPLGIPGMDILATHLTNNLGDKYKKDRVWEQIVEKLETGTDLENALTEIRVEGDLFEDITIETWNLITEADLRVFRQARIAGKRLPLANLINKFYQHHPQCLNIITTNYDRVIEYACDQIRVLVDTRYQGNYIRYFSNAKLKKTNVVNLLKVHGSLDLFRNSTGLVCTIPLQEELPEGFTPEIITPGAMKYKAVLTGDSRNILHEADSVINEASAFLCIGYGFNDEQIQDRVIAGLDAGKPIVLVTKCVSEDAGHLLANHSNNYVIIEENPEKKMATRFTINREYEYLDETYWTIDGFMQII